MWLLLSDELRKEAYVDGFHACERDVQHIEHRNVDACVEEEEELHGDVNNAKVVEDTEVDIHHGVRSYMSAHAVTHS